MHLWIVSFGQCFSTVFELIESYNISNHLESKDTLKITCYDTESKIDSLVPRNICVFTKLPSGAIKSVCSEIGTIKKERYYWKYDDEGYVWKSNKKGILKLNQNIASFYFEESILKGKDSIVNRVRWSVFEKDTIYEVLEKSIYRNRKQIEFWVTPVLLRNTSKSWDSIKTYTVTKFLYPSEFRKVKTKSWINQYRDTTHRYKTILEYDKSNNLTSETTFIKGEENSRRLYYYTKELLTREEYLIDGRIEELLKFEY